MYKDIIDENKERMDKTIKSLHYALNNIRTGRANPMLLDSIKADYYGVETPLNQMAAISSPEARVLQITPWDVKALGAIERAIHMSDIGLNPNNDGKSIRLVFPELNEERRKELAKQAKKEGEESKIAIRSIRKDGLDAIKKLEKDKVISEDDMHTANAEYQKVVDDYIKKIDTVVDEKVNEIMTV